MKIKSSGSIAAAMLLFTGLISSACTAFPNQQENATPSGTPTPTALMISTPSPTHTATVTPTPTPLPPGGAYIRFFGSNEKDNASYCGVMTAEGEIFDQRLITYYNDDEKFAPPFYCPADSQFVGFPKWSPDGKHYFYHYYVQWSGMYEIYAGESHSPRVTLLPVYPPDIEEGYYLGDIQWLDNERLLIFDRHTRKLGVMTLASRYLTSLGEYPLFRGEFPPSMVPSPDGGKLVIQYWDSVEESHIELVTFDGRKKQNLTEALLVDHGIAFPYSAGISWSPDGERVAIQGYREKEPVWIIYGREGEMQSIVEEGEIPIGGWLKWTADGEKILLLCSPKSLGHYGMYDLCLADLDGTVETVFPYQSSWFIDRWSQWSPDGVYLYYLLKSTLPVYPAKLYRLDMRDGTNELVVDGIFDYDWINTDEFIEEFSFTGIKWSPDGEWMILNDSGPRVTIGSGEQEYTTPLLCKTANECQVMKVGSLQVLGAEWWQPPPEWTAGHPLEELDPSSGEVVFEEQFAAIGPATWKTIGDVSTGYSEYGPDARLDGDEMVASVSRVVPIRRGNGILVDVRHEAEAVAQCGLYAESGDISIRLLKEEGIGELQLVIHTPEGEHRQWMYKAGPGTWVTFFARVVLSNQLQALVIDKAYSKVIRGFNIKLPVDIPPGDFQFRCAASAGTIEINRFVELRFR